MKSVLESVSINDEILKDLSHYVKWCRMDDSLFYNINPLEKCIIHNSKKNGKFLLLATLNSMDKKSTEKLMKHLHQNVWYNSNPVDFHTCYLPGDVFVYIQIPESGEIKKEYVNMSLHEKLLSIKEELMMETEKIEKLADKALDSSEDIDKIELKNKRGFISDKQAAEDTSEKEKEIDEITEKIEKLSKK